METITKIASDAAGEVVARIEDYGTSPTNANLQTSYQRDAQERAVAVTNPRGVVTANAFDCNGQNTQSVTDPVTPANPNGLNLIATTSFNAQGAQTTAAMGGYATDATQYMQQTLIDDLNRKVGTAIDPVNAANPNGKLAITTQLTLDSNAQVTTKTDPNGNTTYFILDAKGNELFRVDAKGSVRERQFDLQNHLTFERFYNTAIDLSQFTPNPTAANLLQLLAPNVADPQNSLTYFYYDNNGNECYRVTGLGIVKATTYDKVPRIASETFYSSQLSGIDFATATLATIQQAVAQTPDPLARTTNYIRDAKGAGTFHRNGYHDNRAAF